ncbi:MAG: CDP-diacylglycerol--serine O-phosphatidyltransferase [Bacteroidales bacterium]|nr:CDP-diacylglycerol--serine O-phosphatidyltransferase [Bacteroidales bacterium]
MLKRQIPNLITLCNLMCGVLATGLAVKGMIANASLLILLGILFDFFDGLSARLLKVASPMGKELDSLADVVTSGVAPGFILFNILRYSSLQWIAYVALLIPAFGAYRLAKFNLDTRQGHSFLGLPVPSNALIWVGLALSGLYVGLADWQAVALAVVSLVTCVLMVSELPMFSLKFDFSDLSWRTNRIPYLFLIGCAVIIAATRNWIAISLIIIWYIILSALTQRKQHA